MRTVICLFNCEFDIDAIAAMFADLGKNPEAKKPKIAIKWDRVEQINQRLGANLVVEESDSPLSQAAQGDYSPFDPSADRRTVDETARGGFALPGDPTFKSVLKDNTLGKVGDAIDEYCQLLADQYGGRVAIMQFIV